MSQPFTYPPPPPPPSKAVQSNSDYSARGRDRGNFQQRGRGRGHYSSNGNPRGGYNSYSNDASNHRGAHHTGQKRNHSAAFESRPADVLRKLRPLAPPAVPDFGVNFDVLLQKKPGSEAQSPPSEPVKKTNLLGLTPQGQGNESDGSDDDGDEEAKLSKTSKLNGPLQFEFRGQTSTLGSAEDIAVWIAERRKRWPTEAKRDSATKEAEEKKRKWEEEKASRVKASQVAAKARHEEYQRQKTEREKSRVRQNLIQEQIKKASERASLNLPQTDVQAKADRLRRKAEKIARQLRIAEDALGKREDENKDEDADVAVLLDQVEQAARSRQKAEAGDSDARSLSSDSALDAADDDTSSSGSSGSDIGSDSDAGPEELSSKRTAPERVLAPPRKPLAGDMRPLCNNFTKTGRCKFGRRCHYRHEKSAGNPASSQQTGPGSRRKGLYQVMVDKELEDERKQMLRAIIAWGDAGLLDEKDES